VSATTSGSLLAELRKVAGEDLVAPESASAYCQDATADRGLRGGADAVVLPREVSTLRAVLEWCDSHDVAVVPRGGGTGFAGGAVPLGDGVVVGTERLRGEREIDHTGWTATVDAGFTTEQVRRFARENGLWFPVDPGAAEQSCIGGNIATNAGGPHAFKYGVTARQVLGVEVALVGGELVSFGGKLSKDVAGYPLKELIVGSEGTLGIVTRAILRLIPPPELALPLVAFYPDVAAGCEGLDAARACGAFPAILEYLDGATLGLTAPPGDVAAAAGAGFAVIVEADGSEEQARADRELLREALAEGSLGLWAPADSAGIRELWRWRDGVAHAVNAARGGKLSEDVAVPFAEIRAVIEATLEIGARHDLPACSWGHAGDGNVHATFLVDPADPPQLSRAEEACEELFDLALALGGTVSGEHGVGLVKRAAAGRQLDPSVAALQTAIKRAFDPKGLLNPGKKLPAPA
jgi:glycolate dehydrogenase FAD-linked subunit